ncbi:palmitoyltransferase akr1, variant 2 [Entomophthora muscae]|uniref:Palmitoyltransferase akr1, variant 2 n=1 Tax=Entomophthora muscae TaxID=34485 RepID=A0ACC2SBS8_9FUNG|nr:palmitoyltransferase akr1, variant 2 [Entomophthora muscae]
MGNKKGRDDPSLKQALLDSAELDAEAGATAAADENISKPKGNHTSTKEMSKNKGKRNKKSVLAPTKSPEKENLLEDDAALNSGWEEFPMDEKSDSLSDLHIPSEEISKFQGKGSLVADTPPLRSDPEDIVAEAPPSERQDPHLSEDKGPHLSSSGILAPVSQSLELSEVQETEKDSAARKKRAPLPVQISKAVLAEPKIDNGSVVGITSSKKDLSIPKGEPMGLPSEYDITIIHAAQSGNTIALEYILDKDPNKVNEKDSGDCSPLHWAAINNRIEAARFLLKNGAHVNAQGGDLKATPLHWACRQGLLDMMVLLLEFGADSTSMDSQGFNIVHLSIHSFNFMSLIYSLSLPGLEADVADGQGHTPLMWAAYQGFSQAVELLLKLKADVHARDNTNYTALHWGVVKGDECILQKLIVAHADLMAVDNQGQTPSDLAIVSKTEAAWQSALIAAGHDPADLSKPSKRWTAAQVKRVALALPVPLMSLLMLTIVYAPWEMALPMVVLQLWLFYHFGIKKLLKKCSPALCLQESPYHVGIFLTTVIFTFKTYLATIAPNTFSDYRWTNMVFSSLFAASLYFYWLVTTSDPGFLPRYNTLSDRKELLQSLAQDGRLTLRHFCTSCLVILILNYADGFRPSVQFAPSTAGFAIAVSLGLIITALGISTVLEHSTIVNLCSSRLISPWASSYLSTLDQLSLARSPSTILHPSYRAS